MAPVIAVDLDEVLGYFIPQLCNFHNEKYGTNLSASNFRSYRFCEVWGGDDEQATDKVHEFFRSSHFRDLPVIPGAIHGTAKLRALGYELVVVTSRQLIIEEETRAWLRKNFAPDTFSHIAFGNHWGRQGRKIRKVDLCRELGAQLLIDDSMGYVNEVADAGMRALLFDLGGEYGWNKGNGEGLKEGVRRVDSWDQVVQYVEALKM